MTCDRCGSIQVVRARSQPLDRAILALTGLRPVLCRRCGWQGRKRWSAADDFPRPIAPDELDPSLSVLDDALAASRRPTIDPDAELQFVEPSTLTGIPLSPSQTIEPSAQRRVSRSRRGANRARVSAARKREVIGGIAIAALTTFIVVALILTGSCGQQSIESISENVAPRGPVRLAILSLWR